MRKEIDRLNNTWTSMQPSGEKEVFGFSFFSFDKGRLRYPCDIQKAAKEKEKATTLLPCAAQVIVTAVEASSAAVSTKKIKIKSVKKTLHTSTQSLLLHQITTKADEAPLNESIRHCMQSPCNSDASDKSFLASSTNSSQAQSQENEEFFVDDCPNEPQSDEKEITERNPYASPALKSEYEKRLLNATNKMLQACYMTTIALAEEEPELDLCIASEFEQQARLDLLQVEAMAPDQNPCTSFLAFVTFHLGIMNFCKIHQRLPRLKKEWDEAWVCGGKLREAQKKLYETEQKQIAGLAQQQLPVYVNFPLLQGNGRPGGRQLVLIAPGDQAKQTETSLAAHEIILKAT